MKKEVEHPEKDEMRRDLVVRHIKAVAVILLLFLSPATLYQAFTLYMYHYTLPKGTTVVDRTVVPRGSFPGKYITGKIPRLRPYLEYRHYVIPEGVTKIGEGTFTLCSGLTLRSRTV